MDLKLTISKRFEYALAHRFYRLDWSPEKNQAVFGLDSQGKYGHGHNHEAFFVFEGPIQAQDGMVMELAKVKQKVLAEILSRYDHFYLNQDTSPFDKIEPSVSNVAAQLLNEAGQVFKNEPIDPVVVHVNEKPDGQATAYASGKNEVHETVTLYSVPIWMSAISEPMAVRTAVQVRVTFEDPLDPYLDRFDASQKRKQQLHLWASTLSQSFYQSTVSAQPLTVWIRRWFDQLSHLGCCRLKGSSGSDFAEKSNNGLFWGWRTTLLAGHSLKKNGCSDDQNQALFGRCTRHHGHNFDTEVTFKCHQDSAQDQTQTVAHCRLLFDQWQYKSISHETADFEQYPATCESMILSLGHKLNAQFPVSRLRICETSNNRFTLRFG